VDVGANAGFHTLAFARDVGLVGRVLAIEPGSEACGRLRENVRDNGLHNVEVVQSAAADPGGSLPLHLSAVDLGSSSRVNLPAPCERGGRETAAGTTLDARIEGSALAPDLIEIGVEGMEPEVLRGARVCCARAGRR
jgi:FkbM family methyltransferase